MLRLVIEDDEGKTTVVPLIRDEITIGRKEGNTIRLTERNVSRRHARLLRTVGDHLTVMVEDLDSYNGVKLNGTRITDKAAFQPGDLLQIGDYQLALKVNESRSSGESPTPAAQPSEIDKTSTINLGEAPTLLNQVSAVPLPSEEQAHLVVVSSNLAGETYVLSQRETIVGRTDENDVVINHRSISRNHAKVIARDGSFTIIDLASSNGVKVNGEAFGTASLVNGDIVELGHVKLRYVAPGDNYVFDRADIDDVKVDGQGLPLGRISFVLLLLIAAAGGWYFWQQGGRSGSSQGPTDQGTGLAAAATSQAASAVGQPTEAPPQAGAEDLKRALLVEGNQHLEARRWAEAVRVFDRYLSEDPQHAEARRLRARAAAEQRNEQLLSELNADVRDEQYGEAWMKLTEFPKDSLYWPEVSAQQGRLEQGYADEELERGRALAERQEDLAGARKVHALLKTLPFAKQQTAELGQIIARVEAAQRAAQQAAPDEETPPPAVTSRPSTRPARGSEPSEARRARPTPPAAAPPAATPPASSGPSASQLLAEARAALMGGDRPGAIKKAKQANRADPQAKEAYQLLCTLLQSNNQPKEALQHCKMWQAKESSPAGRQLATDHIRRLEEALGN